MVAHKCTSCHSVEDRLNFASYGFIKGRFFCISLCDRCKETLTNSEIDALKEREANKDTSDWRI